MTPERRAEIVEWVAAENAVAHGYVADLLAALDEREQQIAAVRALPWTLEGHGRDVYKAVDRSAIMAALDSAPKAVGDA